MSTVSSPTEAITNDLTNPLNATRFKANVSQISPKEAAPIIGSHISDRTAEKEAKIAEAAKREETLFELSEKFNEIIKMTPEIKNILEKNKQKALSILILNQAIEQAEAVNPSLAGKLKALRYEESQQVDDTRVALPEKKVIEEKTQTKKSPAPIPATVPAVKTWSNMSWIETPRWLLNQARMISNSYNITKTIGVYH